MAPVNAVADGQREESHAQVLECHPEEEILQQIKRTSSSCGLQHLKFIHHEYIKRIYKPVKFLGATCIILFLLVDHQSETN